MAFGTEGCEAPSGAWEARLLWEWMSYWVCFCRPQDGWALEKEGRPPARLAGSPRPGACVVFLLHNIQVVYSSNITTSVKKNTQRTFKEKHSQRILKVQVLLVGHRLIHTLMLFPPFPLRCLINEGYFGKCTVFD